MRLPVSRLSRVVPCAMLILRCVDTSVLLSQRRQTAPGSASATISERELVRCIELTEVTTIEESHDASRRQIELHQQAKAQGRTHRRGLRDARRSRTARLRDRQQGTRRRQHNGAPSRANTLSSLTAEAKPAWIAPFGNGLELRQAAKRPFPIVRIKARSRQIIVTQPHKGPSAARLKQKFDRRVPGRNACNAAPGKNDLAVGHDLDVVTFDLYSAGFRQAKDATRNGIGIDDFGLPFLYLCRIG